MPIILSTIIIFFVIILFVLIILKISTKESKDSIISKEIVYSFQKPANQNQTLDKLVEFSKKNPCNYKL